MKIFSSLLRFADADWMGAIGTTEAAKRIGVSARRIAAMITQGLIHASKVGNTWIIDEAEVARVKKLARPPGRPRKKK